MNRASTERPDRGRRPASLTVLILATCLAASGCTTVERVAHLYSSAAPAAHTFTHADGGWSTFYSFDVGEPGPGDTVLFINAATGCASLKAVLPDYVRGLTVPARVFAINKRFVPDRATGFDCSRAFKEANNPDQWVADTAAFVRDTLKHLPGRPRNVVMFSASEGAITAARVAGEVPAVTHLAFIGNGGFTLRRTLEVQKAKGNVWFDLESGFQEVAADPRTIDRSWYGNTHRWWSDVLDYDPMPTLMRLDIPILVGIGEKDESAPVEAALYLEQRFRETGKTNLTVRVFSGADHRLNTGGMSYRDEFFRQLGASLR